MRERMKRFDTPQWWENGYLVILCLILIRHFLQTTMLDIPLPPKIGLVWYFLIMCYTCAKMILHKDWYTKKEWIFSCVILILCVTAAIVSDYSFLFELGFLIAGAKRVSFRKMLWVSFGVGCSISFAAYVASQNGWIENLVYPSVRGGVRQSFGSVYPTDFAAHIFYLLVTWLYISWDYQANAVTKKKRNLLILIDCVAMLLAATLVYTQCQAYTSVICIGMMAVGYVVLLGARCLKKKLASSFKIVAFAPVGLAALFIGMAGFYDGANAAWNRLDTLLSTRLSTCYEGIQNYGFTMFGQYVEEFGNGGDITPREHYFFLDDSYIRIAMEYGIVMLVLILVLLVCISYRAVEEQKGMLFLIMFVMAIHCFMEQHLLEVSFQIFILSYFADWTNKPIKKQAGE